MTKEEMIEAIYEKIAEEEDICDNITFEWYKKFKPVMIGDMLDYIENNFEGKEMFNNFKEVIYNTAFRKTFDLWEEKRKPLEMQGDDCIKYIFNLISI